MKSPTSSSAPTIMFELDIDDLMHLSNALIAYKHSGITCEDCNDNNDAMITLYQMLTENMMDFWEWSDDDQEWLRK